MKRLTILLVAIFLGNTYLINAQSSGLPTTRLLTLDGTSINSSEILHQDVTTIIVFWRSYEKKCCEQINLMIEAKEKLEEIANVNIVAICNDTEGLSSRIRPLVSGKDWDINVYIDRNGDLTRAMNIPSMPFTLVFDEEKSLICEYNGYCAWADEMVCDKIKECLQNKDTIQPALSVVSTEY